MSRDVYEKVYFHDDYAAQFGAMRDRYHDRTQEALKGHKKEEAPTPNATTVVFLEDTPDGGVSVSTTGDFVSYFNRQYGYDRLGQMRRSLAVAEQTVELKRAREKKTRLHAEEKTKREKPVKKAKARVRFSLAHALFATVLILSMVIFFGTSALLDNTVSELKALEGEVTTMRASRNGATPEVLCETEESNGDVAYAGVAESEEEELEREFSFKNLLDSLVWVNEAE